MSKALIIKGSDFTAHKVTTITFGSVPCEGISFDEETITITTADPVEVEYTLIPENTTDTVFWSSSDDNVITASGGIITVVGIGTATLTATCGEYTATATVTVNIAYIPKWHFGMYGHASGLLYLSCSGAYSRLMASGYGSQQAQHYIVPSDTWGINTIFPILVPKNTARIKLKRGADKATYFESGGSYIIFLSDTACGDSNFPDAATYISNPSEINMRSNEYVIFDLPENANAIAFHARTSATYTSADDPDAIASTRGLDIEFLTAE